MNDRIWRNVSIGLGVICALLIGAAGALMFLGHRGGSPAASDTPSASQIGEASATPITPGPSSSGCSTACQSGPPSPSAVPVQNATAATIVFNGLTLDAEKDKTGSARIFTFTSYGSDPLSFAVTKNSPGGATRMCISVDGGKATCTVGGLPSNTKARGDAGAKNDWKVTLVGYGNSKPTVDVTFTWPTVSPQIQLQHGRLQGGSSPAGINGFTATFKPRTEGSLNVQASWTKVTADVNITLADVTTPPSVKVDQRQYQAVTYINPPYTYNVDSTKTYLLELRNISADSQRPDLTVQVSFP